MEQLLSSFQETMGQTIPSVLGALAILLAGWFVALIARAAIRRGLQLLRLNSHIETSVGSRIDLEGGVATGAYYVILLLVLVAFFNALKLEQVTGSLQAFVDQVFAFAPKVAAATLILIAAWILATVLRSLSTRALQATRLDERISAQAGVRPISENLGNVLYWLVFLIFLPAILSALDMSGLLGPVQSMVDRVLAILPNLGGALAIGVVGWFVARVLRDLVSNLLAAVGADQLGERVGLGVETRLSALVGLVVYVFVFVPALIAALNALKIEAISQPATAMLSTFLAAIPHVFAAGVILAVAYLVAGVIANLASGLLRSAGFDAIPERVGLSQIVPAEVAPSQLVGRVLMVFVMLFAVVEAANQVGFEQVSALVSNLIAFGAQVVLGLVIITVGFWISRLAANAMHRVSDASAALVGVVRFAILGIVIAMGLRAMGLADDVVNLAFGLTLGAVAVAFALSFGLGGREAAGRQMEHWLSRLRE